MADIQHPGSRGGQGHYDETGKWVYNSTAYSLAHHTAQPRLSDSLRMLDNHARNRGYPAEERKIARSTKLALERYWQMDHRAQEEYLQRLESLAEKAPERVVQGGLLPAEMLAVLHYYDPKAPGEAHGQEDGGLHYEHGNHRIVAGVR